MPIVLAISVAVSGRSASTSRRSASSPWKSAFVWPLARSGASLTLLLLSFDARLLHSRERRPRRLVPDQHRRQLAPQRVAELRRDPAPGAARRLGGSRVVELLRLLGRLREARVGVGRVASAGQQRRLLRRADRALDPLQRGLRV